VDRLEAGGSPLSQYELRSQPAEGAEQEHDKEHAQGLDTYSTEEPQQEQGETDRRQDAIPDERHRPHPVEACRSQELEGLPLPLFTGVAAIDLAERVGQL